MPVACNYSGFGSREYPLHNLSESDLREKGTMLTLGGELTELSRSLNYERPLRISGGSYRLFTGNWYCRQRRANMK